MKRLFTLLLVVAMIFSLVACGGNNTPAVDTNQPTTETNGNNTNNDSDVTPSANADRPFVAGTADFNGDFHAGWTNSSYDANIRQLVWGFSLMTDTPAGEIVDSPLVEEKTVSEDLLTWTFKLVDGITFHNGEALTVSDIKFTYDFYMDEENLKATGGTSSLNDYVESVSIDEAARTITFQMKKVIFTTDLSVFYQQWTLAEDTIKAGAEEGGLTVQEYVKTNISAPVGNGPYRLVEFRESEYVKLERFEDYIGKKPEIKEIIVKFTPSETELDQLLQGEVDLLPRTVEEEKITAAKEADYLTTNNYYRHGGGTMVLHTDYEAFQLTEVRQGFAYVFNRPKVIELFLGEYGIASQGPYSKNHWMMYDDDEADLIGTAAVGRFESTLTDYDILDANGNFDEDANIAKAHELFDIAVAKTDGEYANFTGDGTNGYMWKGEPLNIKIAFTEFWSDTYHLVWNDDYVSKLGFEVTLVGLDWPVMYGHWIGQTTEERQYHAFVGGSTYYPKENPKSGYAVDKILPWGDPSDNGPRFSGGSTYTAEEWDQLLDSIENAHPVTGKDDYRTNWRTFIKTMNDEVPVIPVYSNNYHDLYSSDLENFNTNALWAWPRAILDANWK